VAIDGFVALTLCVPARIDSLFVEKVESRRATPKAKSNGVVLSDHQKSQRTFEGLGVRRARDNLLRPRRVTPANVAAWANFARGDARATLFSVGESATAR
jgi:hypothetical protein